MLTVLKIRSSKKFQRVEKLIFPESSRYGRGARLREFGGSTGKSPGFGSQCLAAAFGNGNPVAAGVPPACIGKPQPTRLPPQKLRCT
jgi:hypothetical protein